MPGQTTVALIPSKGKPGLLGDVNKDYASRSLAFEDTGTVLGVSFGLAVKKGTNGATQFEILESADTAAVVFGVTSFHHAIQNESLGLDLAGNAKSIAAGEPNDIVYKGRIWVVVEEAIALGDAVYVRVVAGAGEQAGAFRNDADGGDAVLLAATAARWVSPSQSFGTELVAELELNLLVA